MGQNWVNDPASLRYVKTPEHQARITAARKKYLKQHPDALAGSNNPRWLGGITPENRRRLNKAKYRRLCKKVLRRDAHRCQNCGRNDRLVVHHLIPWRLEKRDRLKNLITACQYCHMKLEKAFYENKKDTQAHVDAHGKV